MTRASNLHFREREKLSDFSINQQRQKSKTERHLRSQIGHYKKRKFCPKRIELLRRVLASKNASSMLY